MRYYTMMLWLGCLVMMLACSSPPDHNTQDGGVTVPAGDKAFVIGMLGESGAFGLVDVATHQVLATRGPVSNDATARYWNGYMFVVNRLTHDNIQVMETRGFSLLKQYSVGPKSNPQDIAVISKDKAYISRLGHRSLLVVEPLTGKILREIDLGELAETGQQACQTHDACESKSCINKRCAQDGLPENALMHQHKGHVWVMVQRLARNQRFASKHKGKIAIIDTTQDSVSQILDTQGGNPYDVVAHNGILYVSQPGNWMEGTNVVLDGLLEKFDLETRRSLGVALREQTLGGNLSSFAIASASKGYAIRTGDNWSTELVTFNPETAQVGQVLFSSPCLTQGACYTLFSMMLHPSGKLYVVDRHPKKPGIRIFDTSTDQEITQSPLDIGLPPMSVVFFQ